MPVDSTLVEEGPQETTLKDYFDIILKRKNIVISFFIIIISITIIKNIRTPDIYKANAQILIQDPTPPLIKPPPESQLISLSTPYLTTQLEIMKGPSIAMSVVEKLDLTSRYPQIVTTNKNIAARLVKRMISINQVGNTRIFYVNISSSNPNFSAEVANGLVDVYVENNAITSLLFSKELIDKWFPESGGKIKFESIYGKLKTLSREELIQALPSVATNKKIIELKEKKTKLEQDIARYIKRYTEKHPTIVNARKELAAAKEEIKYTAENIVNDIKDAMDVKFQTSNIKIIEYADVPQTPVGPDRKKNIMLASVMAIFLGCSLALFVDYLDNTVKTQDDVERRLKLPYLGYMPLIKEKWSPEKTKTKDYIIVNPDDRKSSLLEALRNVRTSITFSAPPDVLKSILVTSALPKEGKSTIALSLAITFAADGINTLLVDGDMRRPNLHKMLETKNVVGLSNYLTSKISINDILQETRFKNLKLAPCGPIPPNPSGLFGSYRMKEFLDEAKAKFDRIIFDGSPIIGISDSVIMAKALDGLIQIVRFGKVTVDIANKARKRLQGLGIKITGVIINSVDTTKKDSYYYKYYDYSYHKYYE